ncbi:bifunctional UDP-N-acetylglucosamine diphosphorylase/glucosamine-1-phosphate N-acetyltransferase GlmU [Alicyclobacillus sp. TC]|uniref:Bifunctional protein GlmU n=1 Tax=Alicyclobacillus tolerans TaxID=90970 RepID=A0A1M6PH55_9BACL|nr:MULTISPECIES: bifunctional UDP-N-acetylglucosamine diphosphorylase/glucosamine-1-phosphate N-acetyltransferase GlmU [Alicyclobacillus]QRF22349.1 bifunctional UDP-N-acetylglucosamine diphosphorylase/glucosamine-1-phosphate N-acetyltransferase GlmU [Alicyclobacillus sp. TC]SHK07227.1 UDP-N-acetylglucosamine pyrophosphorylase /glucosamine-1-phosphate N-acetyltransferase [Alicyclobacillus montanus]
MGRTAIVLAGGLGTRMKSSLHKVLHPVLGKPMILHILDEIEKVQVDEVIVVVGQSRESVISVVEGRAKIAVQEQQLGTGHAVMAALPHVKADSDTVLILYGDAPLIQASTMESIFQKQEQSGAGAVILAAHVQNPTGLGRVILSQSGQVERVVEERDASPEERQNHLINTGIYCFRTERLREACAQLRPNNAQNEYYLTDTLQYLQSMGVDVWAQIADDEEEVASVNDRFQLAQVEKIAQQRRNRELMLAGVTFLQPDSTWIGADVEIEADVTLYPGCVLEGCTQIAAGAVIGPYTRLVDAQVEAGAVVQNSVVLQSIIGEGAQVGPFAYIRPGSTVGARVKVGDFVELKNTRLGADSKVSHLAYLGDAVIGERVNIGCGVITVNYDGMQKHTTVVGDDSFIGSNANLIAPVQVGEGAYVCAGSTITDNVPDDGFAIARVKQETKPRYVKAWKQKKSRVLRMGRDS